MTSNVDICAAQSESEQNPVCALSSTTPSQKWYRRKQEQNYSCSHNEAARHSALHSHKKNEKSTPSAAKPQYHQLIHKQQLVNITQILLNATEPSESARLLQTKIEPLLVKRRTLKRLQRYANGIQNLHLTRQSSHKFKKVLRKKRSRER